MSKANLIDHEQFNNINKVDVAWKTSNHIGNEQFNNESFILFSLLLKVYTYVYYIRNC